MHAAYTRESTIETLKHVFLVKGSPSAGVHPVCSVCTVCIVCTGVHTVCTSLFADGDVVSLLNEAV